MSEKIKIIILIIITILGCYFIDKIETNNNDNNTIILQNE